MVEVKLGYSGRVLKTVDKDAYIGIHKTVAQLMKNNKICIAFDVKNCEFTFVGFDELSGGRPNFPGFKQTALGKKMMQRDADTPIKSNYLFLKPFKILMSSKADNFFKTQNIFWAEGKINKTKKFQLDNDIIEQDSGIKKINGKIIEEESNIKGVSVKKTKSLSEVLGKGTIWCLCPREMEKRTLAATNPDEVQDLIENMEKKIKEKEDNLKTENLQKLKKDCQSYVSIMKSELAKLDDIKFFKESCELSSQS